MIRQSGIGAHNWDVCRYTQTEVRMDMGMITLLMLCGGIRRHGDKEACYTDRRSDVSRVRTDVLQQHYY